MLDGTKISSAVHEYAQSDGSRLEHLIAVKAREYVAARWRNDGTAGGHFRALEKLVRMVRR